MKQTIITAVILATVALSAHGQEQQKGQLTVDCDQRGATVWVNGKLQGQVPLTLTLQGEHNIVVENDINHYFRHSDLVSVAPGQSLSRYYTLKKMPPKTYVFALAQYGFGTQDFGAMLGVCKHFGGYVRFHAHGSSSGGLKNQHIIVEGSQPVKSLENPYSYGASGGVMGRLCDYLYLFGGIGYAESSPGTYTTTDGRSLRPHTFRYLTADIGAIVKYKALLLSVGYTPAISKMEGPDNGSRYGDLHVGIGITLHKNRKR